MATHICNVDCKPEPTVWRDAEGNPQKGTAHMMYASEPSSAAGRYQWELNRAILDRGRRAWRASGQGQSRECRVWDERRRTKPRAGVRRSRRFYESVGSPWSDAHTLRTFDAWMAEELGR